MTFYEKLQQCRKEIFYANTPIANHKVPGLLNSTKQKSRKFSVFCAEFKISENANWHSKLRSCGTKLKNIFSYIIGIPSQNIYRTI